jgi:hypothetical protein
MIEVLLYGMLELGLGLELELDNPYDPGEVVVDVAVESPDGSATTWPAYYDGEAWMWRYRPLLEGEHGARVLVNGVEQDSFVFHVEPSVEPGPITPEGYGFRHADGSPFVPLGLNLGWSAGGGTDDYDRWFGALAEHGGSFARVWFTHFTDQDPEWPELGLMDPQAAANIDTILDLARAHGLLLMPVLWQHSELETTMWSSWDGNPYNAANGGPCADSACFFEDPEALALQQAYLRYSVARWGAHPALAAWEVMNELDAVVGVDSDLTAQWAAAHAETIRGLEGGLHPVSFSYSLPPQAVTDQAWGGADFTQVHSYLLSDVTPVAQGVAASLEANPLPVLVGEWGLDWFGNADREDREGLAWHNASWAALASGSAGNALCWWWDEHIEPNDLWWRLEGLAALSSGLDLPTMAPVEATVSDDDLEVYARGDGDITLAWVHVIDHTVPEPDVRPVSDETLVFDGVPVDVVFYDTETGAQMGTARSGPEGVISLPEIVGDVALIASLADDPHGAEERGCGCGRSPSRSTGWSLSLLAALLLRARRRE